MTDKLEREPSQYLSGGTEENKLSTSVRVPGDSAEPRSYRTQLKNVAATQTKSDIQHATLLAAAPYTFAPGFHISL
jgi:hypothetical protein